MTKSAVASYRRIWAIALPVMLSNAFAPLLGLVDAGVIGQIGDPVPLAAVALGATFMSSLFWVMNFLGIGVTANVSRAIGRGDQEAGYQHLARGLVLAAVLGVVVVLASVFLRGLYLRYVFASADVVTETDIYLKIRLISAPAIFFGLVIWGWLIAHEKTGTILIIETIRQVINIVLDIIFVLYFEWGIAGVAYATVTAEVVGVIIALIWLRAPLLRACREIKSVLSDIPAFRKLLNMSGFIFGRALLLQAIMMSFTLVASTISDEAVAINGVLMLFIFFTAQATDGFAVAIETLTGQSIGHRNYAAFKSNLKRISIISVTLAAGLALVFALFGDMIFAFIVKNEALQTLAQDYMVYVILGASIGIFSWTLDGVFFGAAKGKEIFIAMLIAALLYALSLIILVPRFENHGLWIALIASYITRAVALCGFYPRVKAEFDED